LCGDTYSVVQVSRLYRAQYAFPDAPLPEQPPLWELVAPPRLPAAPGRYLGLAALIGALLWVVSGFTLLCLALPLCVGAAIEGVLHWEQVQELDGYRRARAVWRAAYYCTTHDRVFLPDDDLLFAPTEFARVLGREALVVAPPPGLVRAMPDALPQANIGSGIVVS
jgi:hypothetical protein